MVEGPKWELALLATVQSFYQRLLSDQLGGEMPAPAELAPNVISRTEDVRFTLDQMHLWIQLLDMAITPAMLRLGVSDLDPEVAEALLRYFARHRDDSGANRDKTDLVATFLFRHPRVPGQWEQRGYGLDGSIPLSPFEIALLEILSGPDVARTLRCRRATAARIRPFARPGESLPGLQRAHGLRASTPCPGHYSIWLTDLPTHSY